MKKLRPLPVFNGHDTRKPSPGSVSDSRSRLGPGVERPEPVSPTGGKRHVELSPIHDFASKLRQPDVLPRLKAYVRWQAGVRGKTESGLTVQELEKLPEFAPVSINLDITTACNFACDHCVDMDILNKGIKYRHEQLLASLLLMAKKGMRSVIVIGGGEPTVYPKFGETVRFMKDLGLQVAVVSNGSGNRKIAEVADCLTEDDWVRLSLDSASDEVFQAMHKPKKAITLDQICEGVLPIKEANPGLKVGFSFVVTWKGASINDTNIVENIHEIVPAAKRARDYRFDYIAYKPFLTRAETNNAEIVDLHDTDVHFDDVIVRLRAEVEEAKKFASETFRVYETTNLKVLENKSYRNYTQQPRTCHMQFFRQILSPLGVYNCPVYRNQQHGCVGAKDAYATEERYSATRRQLAELIATFDASHQCQEVTCLYNHSNWWIEDLIAHPEKLDELEATSSGKPDYFL